MDRKQFFKSGCAAGMLLLWGGMALGMEGCASIPVHKVETPEESWVKVPLDRFGDNFALLLRGHDWEFDLLAIKENETLFRVLEMKCSHFSNPLAFSGKTLTCSMHGSTFDMAGNATKGPATEPLRSLTSRTEGNFLLIENPYLNNNEN